MYYMPYRIGLAPFNGQKAHQRLFSNASLSYDMSGGNQGPQNWELSGVSERKKKKRSSCSGEAQVSW